MSVRFRSLGLGALFVIVCTASLALAAKTSAPKNGDFEQGTLQGWHAENLGGDGQEWIVYRASDQPSSPRGRRGGPGGPGHLYDPPQGKFAADAPDSGGTRFLYRNLHLKAGREITLKMKVFYKNFANEFFAPHTLDNDIKDVPNQQYRIDVMRKSADLMSLEKDDVLKNVFRTRPGDPAKRKPFTVKADLSKLAGKTVTLRLAQADNQFYFFPGVDAVELIQKKKKG